MLVLSKNTIYHIAEKNLNNFNLDFDPIAIFVRVFLF